MLTSPIGIALIKHFEGLSLTPYRCPAGYLTIGYGYVIRKGENLQSITESEAENLLLRSLLHVERAILRLIIAPLTTYQFDALASFTYNLGSGALQRSTLRQKINRGDYDDASNEFLRWIYSGGRIIKGLIRRRKVEAMLFRGEDISDLIGG